MVVSQFVSHGFSETYWDHGRDIQQTAYWKILARPVPVAVAGTLDSYTYDDAAGIFMCTWNESETSAAATRIFIPWSVTDVSNAIMLEPEGEGYTLAAAGETAAGHFVDIPPAIQGQRKLIVRSK